MSSLNSTYFLTGSPQRCAPSYFFLTTSALDYEYATPSTLLESNSDDGSLAIADEPQVLFFSSKLFTLLLLIFI
jgi:hypothetical protein